MRVLVRVSRGDDEGARTDARALLARLADAPRDTWTIRIARAASGRQRSGRTPPGVRARRAS